MIREWMCGFLTSQAEQAFKEGDYTRVRACCQWVLHEQPEQLQLQAMLGEAALAVRDSFTARSCWQACVDANQQDAQAWFNLAKAQIQLADWPAAEQALRQAQALAPQVAEIQQSLAAVERMQTAVAAGAEAQTPAQNLTQAVNDAVANKAWQQVRELLANPRDRDAQGQRAYFLATFYLGLRDEAQQLWLPLAAQERDPECLAAAVVLSLEEQQLGNAERLLQRAQQADASHVAVRLAEAVWYAQHDTERAEKCYQQLLLDCPQEPEVALAVGGFYAQAERLAEAEQVFRQALQRDPRQAAAWYNLGTLLLTYRHDLAEATQCFEQAVERDISNTDYLNNLGVCYRSQGLLDKAEQCFLRILQLKQDTASAWRNLGLVYGLATRHVDAEGCLQRAIALQPEHAGGWLELASQHIQASAPALAKRYAEAALALEANSYTYNVLGLACVHLDQCEEAERHFNHALSLAEAEQQSGPLINLAGLYSSTLRIEQALEILESHLGEPGGFYSNYLFTLNYSPDLDHRQVLAGYRRAVEPVYPPARYQTYANPRSPSRRLKIGYVSPDFRRHACRYFIDPLLRHHDHQRFEIYAYSDVRFPDDITEVFKGMVDHWCHAPGLSHEQLAERIRADGIDILVDLAGHTAGNRLHTFALKPAPVQLSWMGYGYTTGLTQIDYLMCDRQFLPEGYEDAIAEQPWFVDSPLFCYQGNDWPLAEQSPFKRNGYVTFGCLSRTIRLNKHDLGLWAELLQRVPESRLALNTKTLADPEVAERFAAFFTERGVARERLLFGYSSPAYVAMQDIDIILDCFPHNSGTTLFESLWQGLPFVTLRHRPTMGRMGATILHGLGRDEWIADTPEEYLVIAERLASDSMALGDLHGSLRQEMQASLLCNGAAFTAKFESAYQQMWQRFCEVNAEEGSA